MKTIGYRLPLSGNIWEKPLKFISGPDAGQVIPDQEEVALRSEAQAEIDAYKEEIRRSEKTTESWMQNAKSQYDKLVACREQLELQDAELEKLRSGNRFVRAFKILVGQA